MAEGEMFVRISDTLKFARGGEERALLSVSKVALQRCNVIFCPISGLNLGR